MIPLLLFTIQIIEIFREISKVTKLYWPQKMFHCIYLFACDCDFDIDCVYFFLLHYANHVMYLSWLSTTTALLGSGIFQFKETIILMVYFFYDIYSQFMKTTRNTIFIYLQIILIFLRVSRIKELGRQYARQIEKYKCDNIIGNELTRKYFIRYKYMYTSRFHI